MPELVAGIIPPSVTAAMMLPEVMLLADTPRTEELGARHYAAVVVRVLLDGQGGLVTGEIVDANGAACGRFDRWTGIQQLLRRCLAAAPDDSVGAWR